MGRFKEIRHPEGDPELAALYEECIEAGFVGDEPGVPSDFVLSLSGRRDLLRSSMIIAKTVIGGGVVPLTVKQMVLMAIAMQNGCTYCRMRAR